MTLYFSRLTLNREASARALVQLINPKDAGAAADAHHRLIWSVFADSPARTRDFLWRYDGQDRFYTLSARPPRPGDLFGEPAIKTFAPDLREGDRLRFTLRANATKDRARATSSRRVDVVMDLLHNVDLKDRAAQRQKLAHTAGEAWLNRQGALKGFAPAQTVVEGYSTLELGRKRRKGASFGLLDISGELSVTEPDRFLAAMASGFGRAKAWGCGLMLIRRT